MSITRTLEAYDLAKLALNDNLKCFFKDAKIEGEDKEKKLCFYFANTFDLASFEKEKENILKRLRQEYKKKLELYKRIDLVFYSISAKQESLGSRSQKEQEVLKNGLARLEETLKRIKNEKRNH